MSSPCNAAVRPRILDRLGLLPEAVDGVTENTFRIAMDTASGRCQAPLGARVAAGVVSQAYSAGIGSLMQMCTCQRGCIPWALVQVNEGNETGRKLQGVYERARAARGAVDRARGGACRARAHDGITHH